MLRAKQSANVGRSSYIRQMCERHSRTATATIWKGVEVLRVVDGSLYHLLSGGLQSPARCHSKFRERHFVFRTSRGFANANEHGTRNTHQSN